MVAGRAHLTCGVVDCFRSLRYRKEPQAHARGYVMHGDRPSAVVVETGSASPDPRVTPAEFGCCGTNVCHIVNELADGIRIVFPFDLLIACEVLRNMLFNRNYFTDSTVFIRARLTDRLHDDPDCRVVRGPCNSAYVDCELFLKMLNLYS
jgi:hypothetical protein